MLYASNVSLKKKFLVFFSFMGTYVDSCFNTSLYLNYRFKYMFQTVPQILGFLWSRENCTDINTFKFELIYKLIRAN